jgi:hypothetical protein
VTEPPELLVLFAAEPELRAPERVEPELVGVFREPLLFCGVDFWGGIETSIERIDVNGPRPGALARGQGAW